MNPATMKAMESAFKRAIFYFKNVAFYMKCAPFLFFLCEKLQKKCKLQFFAVTFLRSKHIETNNGNSVTNKNKRITNHNSNEINTISIQTCNLVFQKIQHFTMKCAACFVLLYEKLQNCNFLQFSANYEQLAEVCKNRQLLHKRCNTKGTHIKQKQKIAQERK